VFKTIELGAWYRIRWEGKSVFGKALERHRNSYTFRYADEKGKARTAKVSRSDIFGRLGEHLIPELESAIAPAKRRRTTQPKAPDAINSRDVSTAGESTQPLSAPPEKTPLPRKASTVRKKRKPSREQKRLFPES
jgi:hypothetical protein